MDNPLSQDELALLKQLQQRQNATGGADLGAENERNGADGMEQRLAVAITSSVTKTIEQTLQKHSIDMEMRLDRKCKDYVEKAIEKEVIPELTSLQKDVAALRKEQEKMAQNLSCENHIEEDKREYWEARKKVLLYPIPFSSGEQESSEELEKGVKDFLSKKMEIPLFDLTQAMGPFQCRRTLKNKKGISIKMPFKI